MSLPDAKATGVFIFAPAPKLLIAPMSAVVTTSAISFVTEELDEYLMAYHIDHKLMRFFLVPLGSALLHRGCSKVENSTQVHA